MDFKDIIVSELELIRKKELQDGAKFKAIAYTKVIKQLKDLASISSIDDLNEIKGIGEGITKKINEIIEKGRLEVVDDFRNDASNAVVEQFMNIYGIGRVKAIKLVKEDKIKSMEELVRLSGEDENLLNTNQKKGLLYYEDFLQRIPRTEMTQHKRILKKIMKPFEFEIVGSYRRGEKTSGDIDVLIKLKKDDEHQPSLTTIVEKMRYLNYIVDSLALGEKKFMGVCKVGDGETARRLDILLTAEEEYPFAIMYFTGSVKFNIGVRQIALDKGYSMNEHGFTPKPPNSDEIKTEDDIFTFLGIMSIPPTKRKDEGILAKSML